MWDEALDYWWWWTRVPGTAPQVDEMPEWLHHRVRLIEQVADAIRAEQSR